MRNIVTQRCGLVAFFSVNKGKNFKSDILVNFMNNSDIMKQIQQLPCLIPSLIQAQPFN